MLCLVHCLVFPMLFAASSSLGAGLDIFHHDHSSENHQHPFWADPDYIFGLIGLFAVYYSVKHSKMMRIRLVLALSWLVLAAGLVLNQLHIHEGEYLIHAGAIMLLFTHIYNLVRPRLNGCQVNSTCQAS